MAPAWFAVALLTAVSPSAILVLLPTVTLNFPHQRLHVNRQS